MVRKKVFEIGEIPEIGNVPEKMYAYTIRRERFGPPESAFKRETVDVPALLPDEVLVYVASAGVNYNGIWAALGKPIDVITPRLKKGEKEDFHIAGSDASGVVFAVGKEVKNVNVGDEVVIHCGQWDRNDPWVKEGKDPMLAPSQKIWGYETNWGSFAQFAKVQDHQCLKKPAQLTWEQASSYMLVGATAQRMLFGWPGNTIKKNDVALIWGGSGGLGSMAIQVVLAAGGIPVAVTSTEAGKQMCLKLGAKGVIDRTEFDHWGALDSLNDSERFSKFLAGAKKFGSKIWDILGERRDPNIVFEHPGEATIPTSIFVCEKGGMVVICAGTTGFRATVDLRYHWMKQKRLQGSHFANDEQARAFNDMVASGKISLEFMHTYKFDEIPKAHQLMLEHKQLGLICNLVNSNVAGLKNYEELKSAHAKKQHFLSAG